MVRGAEAFRSVEGNIAGVVLVRCRRAPRCQRTHARSHAFCWDPGRSSNCPGCRKLGNGENAHALALFAIDPAGRVCLDLGASTGGFTDVLLQGGAARVYAVDVGRGQLAPRLGQDARVVVVDGTNARDLGSAHVPEPVELITCDVSFVGLRLALPAALALAAPAAHLIALIKPQFEVGKGRVGKGGVVRDTELHEEVCARLSRWLAEGVGWTVLGLCESPITGPRGNREFLVAARLEALYQSMA